MPSSKLHIGTSGWSYKDWVGPFYPPSTKQAEYLSFYAGKFDCVEIDSTFYGTPRQTTVEKWATLTKPGFIFAPKVPKEITHQKRLKNCSAEWSEYVQTMQILGPKLGPVVLQFDFNFTFEKHFKNLEEFLEKNPYNIRMCVEVRHKSWINDLFYDLLKKHNIALVLNDLYYMPRLTEITADFTYIRLLGNRKLVPDNFTERRIDRSKELDWWTDWVEKFLSKDLEVFAFSNNRYEGFALATIKDLMLRLK